MALRDPVLIAEIGAAHGIRGEVRVKAHTADPDAIGDYGPLYAADGRAFTIERGRPLKDDMLVVKFAGIADRNAAETLTRVKLYVERAALPEPEEDEFYYADLIGLAAVTTAGEPLGRIIALHNFGADDLLEVRPETGQSVLVPFTKAVVPSVDIAGGKVTIDPPVGLFGEAGPFGEGGDPAASP
jgi:16S rRNA processing protein RimM